jgi:GTP-binding protein Era
MIDKPEGEAGHRCGHITLIGRPNVGKSTLLNSLLRQKLSITSRKPQTTRWQLLGIKTEHDCQAIYIDTPGLQSEFNSPLHKHMHREALGSLEGVDLVIFVLEALKWPEADARILEIISGAGVPYIAVINKIDKLKSRSELLPYIAGLPANLKDHEVIPVSARTGVNLEDLERTVCRMLPVAPPLYPEDQITTRNERFFAAEFIREKLIERLGDELPYRLAVTIEQFSDKRDIIVIKGIIWVESNSQKSILVGKKGGVMKAVGEAARKDMEEMFQKKVFLRNTVKVKRNWTMHAASVEKLGHVEQ